MLLLAVSLCALTALRSLAFAKTDRRICETQGTCVDCGDERYSYYKCRGMHECFPGERCTSEGFCCPVPKEQRNASPFLDSAVSQPLKPLAFTDHSLPCPDGSSWHQACHNHTDCNSDDQVCAEGKCCSACVQRRRQVLEELPTNDVLGVHIPQCENDGRTYRAEQCRTGTDECWCVGEYGRMIGTLKVRSRDGGNACREMRKAFGEASGDDARFKERDHPEGIADDARVNDEGRNEETQARRYVQNKKDGHELGPNEETVEITTTTGNENTESKEVENSAKVNADAPKSDESGAKDSSRETKKYLEIMKMLARQPADGDDRLNDTDSEGDDQCVIPWLPECIAKEAAKCGPNEEFAPCFDPCQPSCSSLDSQPCVPVNCRGGCRCKPGYVRRLSGVSSDCVPRAQCTLESVDSANRCNDVFKEYTSCGPACPISCATRNVPPELCNEHCTPGCFCKIPYIIENENDITNSRCILPAQCPHISHASPTMRLSPIHSEYAGSFGFPQPTFPVSVLPAQRTFEMPLAPNPTFPFPDPLVGGTGGYGSVRSTPVQCVDPLKNFQTCGSSCPVGCNSRVGSVCAPHCVSGCFCRSPYILQDASNTNSGCVLPQNCQTFTANQQVCSDPRKQWTSCVSPSCARSCLTPLASCSPGAGDCSPGCVCREPYVQVDAKDSNSRCVLPTECASSQAQCIDQHKEFQACASSCPIACNNRIPQTCTPCVSGCFCKLGYIFEDSTNWRTSRCVPITQCPNQSTSLASIPAPAFGTVPTVCPTITTDVNGRFCNLDTDCPSSQKCCRATTFALGGGQQLRCTCMDPHAIWNSCGSLCPEYCGQPSVPVCSSTCSPGCHCAPGYVKARNDVAAPCVPRTQCLLAANSDAFMWNSTSLGEAQRVATVEIRGGDGEISGLLNIRQWKNNRLTLSGDITGLPLGDHAVAIHQFGDISEGCKNVGPILMLNDASNTSAVIGDISASPDNTPIAKELEWSDASPLLGRSIVIHDAPVTKWLLRDSDEPPLACGTIGVSS